MFEEMSKEEVLIINGGGLAYDAAKVMGWLVAFGINIGDKLSQFDPAGIEFFIMSDSRLWIAFSWLII